MHYWRVISCTAREIAWGNNCSSDFGNMKDLQQIFIWSFLHKCIEEAACQKQSIRCLLNCIQILIILRSLLTNEKHTETLRRSLRGTSVTTSLMCRTKTSKLFVLRVFNTETKNNLMLQTHIPTPTNTNRMKVGFVDILQVSF